VIVDLTAGATIHAETERSGAGFTPWEGVQTGATIERTLLRGQTIYAEETVAADTHGRYLSRPHSSVRRPKGDRR
jgi:dihydroorotase-like cyclic amidohydrolase